MPLTPGAKPISLIIDPSKCSSCFNNHTQTFTHTYIGIWVVRVDVGGNMLSM